MKYKCLILDHDDTVVNSTATIHYPSFIEYLKIYRPERVTEYTPESFIEKNFSPGIVSLFADELSMNEDEMRCEQSFWEDYVRTRVPKSCEGIKEILEKFKAEGGIIAVSSHSMRDYIERDYKENSLPMPDEIFGWDLPKHLRKPATYTVECLTEKYSLTPADILMVDDLKPGFDMAHRAGIDFAAAGWAYNVPLIESFMRSHSKYYLKSTEELYKILF